MFLLFLGLFIFSLLFVFCMFTYFTLIGRFSSLTSVISSFSYSIVNSKVGLFSLYFLFVCFLLTNLIGNIPLNTIPTMYYSFTLSVSLLFWLSIMICVSFSQAKDFLAHMLPYGAPVSLILFLPLVEIFSQIIRPLTLMIRLSTNLSSGHIMMYMFSYFTLLSSFLSPFIYSVLFLLFVLELAISALQAYIFVSLLCLYMDEVL